MHGFQQEKRYSLGCSQNPCLKRIERQSMPRGSWFNAAAQERSRPDQRIRILFVLIKNVYNLMLQLGFFSHVGEEMFLSFHGCNEQYGHCVNHDTPTV